MTTQKKVKLLIVDNSGGWKNDKWGWVISLSRRAVLTSSDYDYCTSQSAERAARALAKKLGLTITKVKVEELCGAL